MGGMLLGGYEICGNHIKRVLNDCVQEVFESLTYSTSGKEVSDTVLRCKESLVDIEVLRKALKKWYEFRKTPDSSKRRVAYYMNGNFGIPKDVLRTVKLLHNSTG